MKNRKFLFLILSTILVISMIFCVGCTSNNGSENNTYIIYSNSGETSSNIVVDNTTINLSNNKVVLCVGDTFNIEATTDGNIPLEWSFDGNASTDIVSFTKNGNNVVINALTTGQTILIVSYTKENKIYYRTVSVQVKEKNDVTISLDGDIQLNENGYFIELSTVETENDKIEAILSGSVYKGNVVQNKTSLIFESTDETIVQIINGKAQAVSSGETTIIAKCIVGEIEQEVEINVSVYKPTILCEEELQSIEVENLQKVKLTKEIEGNTDKVFLDGELVGEYDKINNEISFIKSNLPTSAKKLGEGRILSLTTNKATYEYKINVYTKIIRSKEDLDNMATISKACSTNSAVWDGYFVLGNNIEYNGSYTSAIANQNTLWAVVEGQWTYGGLHGFKGVFDGKNYNINGLEINCGNKQEAWGLVQEMGGIFGVTNIEGLIKNVSFTHAKVSANTSFLTSAGGGTVENVYIQFDEVGTGTERSATSGQYCGAFFSYKEPIHTATVKNCVVDLTNAKINSGINYVMCGSNPTVKSNVIIIGGTEEIRLSSGANYSYSSNTEFVEDNNIQAKYNKKFNDEFWSKVGGVPISNAQYELIKDNSVSFTEKPTTLKAGQTYTFKLNNIYAGVTCTSGAENVTIANNIVTISDEVAEGTHLTFKATSYFNDSKTDTFTVTIIKG